MADESTKPQESAEVDGSTATATPPQDAGTLSGEPLKELGDERAEAVGSTDAVKGAARGEKLNTTEQSKALQWFMKSSPDAGEGETKVLKLNFGTSDDPEWIEWKIKPVQLDRMRQIRRQAASSREAKRTGSPDEYRVNLEIVVAGTIDPDVAEAARLLHQEGKMPTNDPASALRVRFQNKPGYIAQISGEIMSLSGFNDDDVTEREQVDAAGNS